MENKLELKKKIISLNSIQYLVSVNGKDSVVTEPELMNLIVYFPSKERNCRVIDNVISLKQGKLPVVTQSTENKAKKHIKIVTGLKEKDKFKFINSNDAAFYYTCENTEFLKKYAGYIYAIDKAKIINYEREKAETPYGICNTGDLSTGLKTLLNVLYFREYRNEQFLININECGPNVLKFIFPAVADSNITLYLKNGIYCGSDEYTYIVNGKKLNKFTEFFSILREGF